MSERPLSPGDVVVFFDPINTTWSPMRVKNLSPGAVFVLLVDVWANEYSLGRVCDIELIRRAVWSFAGPVKAS